MSHSPEQKVLEHLSEAHAAELAMARSLRAQALQAPRGAHRRALEAHAKQTSEHARRLDDRMSQLGRGANPLQAIVGVAESAVSQIIAYGRTPLDFLRGSGAGEAKLLSDAKAACAAEALEIATYTALERIALSVDDGETAELATSIRADEEQMLTRLLRAIPALAEAEVEADVRGGDSYDIGDTGAGENVRALGTAVKDTATTVQAEGRKAARTARKIPGVARAEGEIKGAVASQSDLAIKQYDDLTADEVTAQLPNISQIELAKVEAYERKGQNRSTVISRIATLRAQEPWPGYDELTVAQIRATLDDGSEELRGEVHSYERAHKKRSGVLDVTEHETANA